MANIPHKFKLRTLNDCEWSPVTDIRNPPYVTIRAYLYGPSFGMIDIRTY